MAYLTYTDLRPGSALWPDTVIDTEDANDARVTTAIAAAKALIDRECKDVFETVEDATIELSGTGSVLLPTVGYRLQTVTTVTATSPDDLAETVTDYRVFSWGIERTDGVIFPELYTVTLAGVTYGWTSTPNDIKRAVALLVYDELSGRNVSQHKAIRWQTGDAIYEIDPASKTGIPEVDRILQRYLPPPHVGGI